jgi:cell division transport system permease protein
MTSRAAIAVVSALLVAGLGACSSGTIPVTPPHPVTSLAPVPADVVVVNLNDDASPGERQAIQKDLQSQPGVRSVTYQTREQTFERAKQEFANDPQLLRELRPEAFPNSFQVQVEGQVSAPVIGTIAGRLAGVKSVQLPPKLPAMPTH